jgi:hypothetical protein
MKGLLRLLAFVVGISLLCALFTSFAPGTLDSKTLILGLPVVSVAQVGAQGWLALGQAASGVLVIGQAGFGIVTIAQGGVGVLFGIGQGMLSMVGIAQVGVGAFVYMGQVGLGAQAIGQGVFMRRSREYFGEMSRELDELLRLPRSPSGAS